MAEEDSVYQNNEDEFVVSAGEQIKAWAERPYQKDAVFVRGTSVETLIDAARTGIVPTRLAETYDLAHPNVYSPDNAYLYYMYPIFSNLQSTNPEVTTMLINRGLRSNMDDFFYSINLSTVHRDAELYAEMQAVRDYFKTQTGIIMKDDGDILYLAHKRLPDHFERASSLKGRALHARIQDQLEGDTANADELERKLEGNKLDAILEECLKRRGVLIYLDKSALEKAKATDSPEEPAEILLVSKDPLPTSTICGVQLLSDRDREIAYSA